MKSKLKPWQIDSYIWRHKQMQLISWINVHIVALHIVALHIVALLIKANAHEIVYEFTV